MYLVFDIGGTAIKYCWMNEAGEIFNKQDISSFYFRQMCVPAEHK